MTAEGLGQMFAVVTRMQSGQWDGGWSCRPSPSTDPAYACQRLGSGKRMFPESDAPLRLRLTATAVTTTGVVINSYVMEPVDAESPHPPAGGWGDSDE